MCGVGEKTDTDQWSKTDDQELDIRVYENFVQGKQHSVQRGKNGLFNKWYWRNLLSVSKKTVDLSSYYTYILGRLKCVKDKKNLRNLKNCLCNLRMERPS